MMTRRFNEMVISREFRILADQEAARIAYILGEQSAIAKAIADRDMRRGTGEDAVILMRGPRILVGPRPSTE